MSLNAATIEVLIGKGLSATDILDVARAVEVKADRTNAERPCTLRDEHSEARDSNRSRRMMPDSEWRALRLRIFERDGHACTYCGSSEDLTCDHVVALARGGTNDEDNLTTACRPCNSSKGDRVMEAWGQWL